MRTAFFPALAGLLTQLGSVLAEDLLFVDSLQYVEYKEATTTLGYTGMRTTFPCGYHRALETNLGLS